MLYVMAFARHGFDQAKRRNLGMQICKLTIYMTYDSLHWEHQLDDVVQFK